LIEDHLDALPKLLLTGASGTLAPFLRDALDRHWDVVPFGNRSLPENGGRADFGIREEAFKALDECRPNAILHAAALTDVDRCEREPDAAFHANVASNRHISEWCLRQSAPIRLLTISTDQVYSGLGPFDEAQVRPSNVYGLTKLSGEALAGLVPNSLIVRVNFFAAGPTVKAGLTHWLINALLAETPITLFDDVLFNPLYAGDFGDLVADLLRSPATGVVNAGARSPVSKAEFAIQIANAFGLSLKNAKAGSVDDGNLSAKRPKDMRMNLDRIETILARSMPTVSDGIERLANDSKTIRWVPGR